ncbi:hypothetical protein [Pelomonas cellulosilytica]|uniref:Glycosyltransferase n=1 Tax=Pelomonas cellulosilytica TaxID=2906762 RepID=A0ABS8Y295_9BURK|nr:hypothetical protein [Pelomonas sp. P8]MCE4557823.1 hypothetical protein [Pelomonas sp. P8]
MKKYLGQTLASIAAQTVSGWECIVVANRGADLPDLPKGCRAEFVDLPLPALPDRTTMLDEYYDGVRADKGQRIYAGVRAVASDSHVMVVDFDDFVSCRLAEFVVQNRTNAGWNIEDGYLWSGGGWCYLQSRFHEMCGTSHIIRRDLLGVFEQDGKVDMDGIKRRLGSHIFIHRDLAIAGHPLSALPFPGAIYRIGNAQSTSGNGALFRVATPPRQFFTHPFRASQYLLRYRRVGVDLRNEFSIFS